MSARPRLAAAAVSATTLAVAAVGLATPAQAATSSCAVTWGSLPKTAAPIAAGPVTDLAPLPGPVRVGHHACYDRIVLDVVGSTGPSTVEYTTSFSSMTGSAPAGTYLSIRVPQQSRLYADITNQLTPTGLPTARAIGGHWVTPTAQGVDVQTRARLPFRVFTLKGPGATNRVVVDVAHRW